ncbi:MAG: hypothetical protein IPP67_03125, partial [Rhodospirillaceae bacterium]|nr:hypothetical protein [Rhodospirillaceae bacterium]
TIALKTISHPDDLKAGYLPAKCCDIPSIIANTKAALKINEIAKKEWSLEAWEVEDARNMPKKLTHVHS